MKKKIIWTIFLAILHALLWFILVIPFLVKNNLILEKFIVIALAIITSIISSKIPHLHPKSKILRISIVITVIVLVIFYYYNFESVKNLINF